MIDQNIQGIRRDYKYKSLDIKDVSINPFSQFEIWFNEILKSELLEPTAFILATSTIKGKPSARALLLKGFDENGYYFYTNYNSRKGRDLKENDQASMLFFWPELERQVRIEGRAVKLNPEKSFEYFKTRPFKSKLGAWASEQSKVIPGRMTIIRKFFEYLLKFHGRNIPLPPYWGGYRLIPEEFEFWQGRANRLHDRIRYKINGDSWLIERLSP
jgi:pyridoxamine 5'-phosphate oxidase